MPKSIESRQEKMISLIQRMTDEQMQEFVRAIRHDIPTPTWDALKSCVETLGDPK